MALSSVSTAQEVWAAYDDNAGYDAVGSVAQAQAFVAACRIILRRNPKRSAAGDGSEIETDPRIIQAEKEEGQRFIANNRAGRVRFASFEDFS